MPDEPTWCCAMEICCGKKAGETDEQYFDRRVLTLTLLLTKDVASDVERHAVRAAVRKLLKHAVIAPLEFGPAIKAVAVMARAHPYE